MTRLFFACGIVVLDREPLVTIQCIADLFKDLLVHHGREQGLAGTDNAIDTCTANIWPRSGRSASEGRKMASTNDKATRISLRLGKYCSQIAEKIPKLSGTTKSVTCAELP
jgi:hypothetical protein